MVGYVIYSPTRGFYAVDTETNIGNFVTGDDFDKARVYENEEWAEIISEIVSWTHPDVSVQGMHLKESVWAERIVRHRPA